MSKIGRNDPCPCGSGKKYKKCCGLGQPDTAVIEAAHRFAEARPPLGFPPGQTYREALGAPNLATQEIHRLDALMEGMTFETKEDFDAFMQGAVASQNAAPREDFLGLSAEDMHGILQNPAKACASLLDFPGPLAASEAQAIPILRQATFLLDSLCKAPLDLTKSGTLKPGFIKPWFEASCQIKEDPETRARMAPRYQADSLELSRTRHICEATGLCKAGPKQLCITPKGQKMLADADSLGLYRVLFLGYLKSYADRRLELNDRVPDIAQEALLFGLYLVDRLARPEVEKELLGKVFSSAFFEEEDEEDPMTLSYLAATACVLPGRNLGLIEEDSLMDFLTETPKVKRSELYPRLVHWKK